MAQTMNKYLTEYCEKQGKTQKHNEKIKISFMLCFCLIMGLILRLWGIDFGLPFFKHPDEGAYLPRAVDILHTLHLNPHYFHNPPLLTYMYSVAMFLYFLFGKLFGWFTSTKDFQELFLSNGTSFFVVARSLNALLSVGICLLVYKVGKKLFDKVTGLIFSLRVGMPSYRQIGISSCRHIGVSVYRQRDIRKSQTAGFRKTENLRQRIRISLARVFSSKICVFCVFFSAFLSQKIGLSAFLLFFSAIIYL